jgi:sugar (pentulose or hexulose) kinase
VPDGPALGSAILAAVGAGIYPDVPTAAGKMVQVTRRIEPNPAVHEAYRFYVEQYIATYPAVQELTHAMTRHVAAGPS